MDIPDPAFWGGVATVLTALVGYVIRNEGRLKDHLTREEHQSICDRSHRELNRKLDDLKRLMEESRVDRQDIRSMMHALSTQVAVIRQRLGDHSLNDDRGLFKGPSR